PRIEIQWCLCRVCLAHELVAIRRIIVRFGDGRRTDERARIGLFDRPGNAPVELEIVLLGPGPEELTEIRLVPDLPVTNVVVVAVRPPAVVVKHDVFDDGRVSIEVRRRRWVGSLAAADPE